MSLYYLFNLQILEDICVLDYNRYAKAEAFLYKIVT